MMPDNSNLFSVACSKITFGSVVSGQGVSNRNHKAHFPAASPTDLFLLLLLINMFFFLDNTLLSTNSVLSFSEISSKFPHLRHVVIIDIQTTFYVYDV